MTSETISTITPPETTSSSTIAAIPNNTTTQNTKPASTTTTTTVEAPTTTSLPSSPGVKFISENYEGLILNSTETDDSNCKYCSSFFMGIRFREISRSSDFAAIIQV